MLRSFLATLLVSVSVAAPAAAQTSNTPAAPGMPGTLGGIQSANIFEVRPDASELPGYESQTNAERKLVQPGNNAPMWRQVSSGQPGYSSLPHSQAPEAGVLVQPFVQYPGSMYTTAGEAWRQTRNNWLIPYGGSLLLIVLVALALFYVARGKIRTHGQPTGRVVERFTYFERAAHWVNAVAFCVLAISGIVMAFGKMFLLPWMGLSLFGWMTWALKTVHNFVGPLFAVSLVVIIVAFLRDNVFRRYDWTWLRKGGGIVGKAHVPSGRFNAGEKIVFWVGVFFFGLVVVGSGLVMNHLVPGIEYTRGNMQIAHLIHAASAVLMMALFLGHIYLGTIGMEGAYRAMKTGYVDEAWAREHHEYWHDDIKAGRVPAVRSARKPASEKPVRPARV
jgi:formate dehydrogenase subunit gamma